MNSERKRRREGREGGARQKGGGRAGQVQEETKES